MHTLYQEQRSWLHSVPVGVKIVFVAVLGTALFLAGSVEVLAAAAAGSVALVFPLRPLGAGAARLVRSIAVAALLVASFHAAMSQTMLGITSALRVLAMSLLGIAFTVSTRPSDLLEVLERWLSPLSALGLRVDRAALRLALMMRFVEHFFVQWKRLDDAHRVRTGRPGDWRLLAPLTIQLLLGARRVGDTVQLRLD